MSVLTDLPKLLKSGARHFNVPGATLAVYSGGGSISKIFTATLIMQLADEGQLDLDVPVRQYRPGFRVADPLASRTATPRHLLTHTSGLEGDLFVDSGRGDDNMARLQDMGTMLPSLFTPGDRLSYCNFGFAMPGTPLRKHS